jgi:hypothetical protein
METSNSDWDFSMLNFDGSYQLLEVLGYVKITRTDYKDLLISDVYRKSDSMILGDEKGIDIQIYSSHSFVTKILAQYHIRKNMDDIKPLWDMLGKENRHILWNYTINVLDKTGVRQEFNPEKRGDIFNCLKAIEIEFN